MKLISAQSLMQKILLLLMLVFFLQGSLQAQLTPQPLSEKVKVIFPGIPEEKKLPAGGSMYMYAKDTGTGYMAMGLDLTAMGISSEIVTALGDVIWEQLKAGIPAQMGGVTIAKDQIIQFKGQNCLYLELDGTRSENEQFKGKKAFGYLFFLGSVLHQVMYLSAAPNASADDAAPFFNSIEIAR
ncbi:MAG: hypothetical protein JNK08_08930 [Sediminibacterium sp.]|nr:hypothetical protein [Sediminibacterium sp.]